MENIFEEPIAIEEPVEKKSQKRYGLQTFTIEGKEKREYLIERGNAGSSKLYLPPSWTGKKVVVILID